MNNDNESCNKSFKIRIYKIVYGSGLMPCHLFASETSDSILFETNQGLDCEYVRDCLVILFDDVHNVEYNPSTGNGCYTAIDFTPKIESYFIQNSYVLSDM